MRAILIGLLLGCASAFGSYVELCVIALQLEGGIPVAEAVRLGTGFPDDIASEDLRPLRAFIGRQYQHGLSSATDPKLFRLISPGRNRSHRYLVDYRIEQVVQPENAAGKLRVHIEFAAPIRPEAELTFWRDYARFVGEKGLHVVLPSESARAFGDAEDLEINVVPELVAYLEANENMPTLLLQSLFAHVRYPYLVGDGFEEVINLYPEQFWVRFKRVGARINLVAAERRFLSEGHRRRYRMRDRNQPLAYLTETEE